MDLTLDTDFKKTLTPAMKPSTTATGPTDFVAVAPNALSNNFSSTSARLPATAQSTIPNSSRPTNVSNQRRCL